MTPEHKYQIDGVLMGLRALAGVDPHGTDPLPGRIVLTISPSFGQLSSLKLVIDNDTSWLTPAELAQRFEDAYKKYYEQD